MHSKSFNKKRILWLSHHTLELVQTFGQDLESYVNELWDDRKRCVAIWVLACKHHCCVSGIQVNRPEDMSLWGLNIQLLAKYGKVRRWFCCVFFNLSDLQSPAALHTHVDFASEYLKYTAQVLLNLWATITTAVWFLNVINHISRACC